MNVAFLCIDDSVRGSVALAMQFRGRIAAADNDGDPPHFHTIKQSNPMLPPSVGQ